MDRPNPPGWKGGSEDFGFLRIHDGHLSTNFNLEDVGSDANEDERRNVYHGGFDSLGDEFDEDS